MKISLSAWLVAAALALNGVTAAYSDEGSVLSRPAPEGVSSAYGDETAVSEPTLAPTLFSNEAAQNEVGNGLAPSQFDDSSDYLPTSVGSDFYTATKRGAGFIGGGEFLLMRLYAAGGRMDMGFAPAYRTWIGYQNVDGLGGRIRYWNYNHTETFFDSYLFHDEIAALDGELTQQVDYYSWNFLVSGGVRQVESRTTYRNVNFPSGSRGGFSGAGLTCSLTATRDLNASGSFRFLAGARWTSVFGNTQEGSFSHLGPNWVHQNTTVNAMELNAGLQFVRDLENGALLTIFGGVETQQWNNGVGMYNHDLGLLGFSTSVSILR